MANTQGDMTARMVTFANLVAMCDRASGVAHCYSAELRKTVCELTYSNPDEYGYSRPYTVRLPVVRNDFDRENPYILFHVQSEFGAEDEYGREACFQTIEAEIFEGPELFCAPDSKEWKTRAEFAKSRSNQVFYWSKPYGDPTIYANGKPAFQFVRVADKESGACVIPPELLSEMCNRYAHELEKWNRRDNVWPVPAGEESV